MFDIKLKDGRYFSNVTIVDEITGDINDIKNILNNTGYKMFIYYINDADEEDLLTKIVSDDIEYICKAYEYKEDK